MNKKRGGYAQGYELQPLQPLPEDEAREPRKFLTVPTSTASNLIFETLGAGENIADLPDRKEPISHGQTLTVQTKGNSRRVILESPKASVTVELADIDKLTGTNKQAKKLFVLALVKANEQAIHDGQLTRNYVSFPLHELIDTGFYSAIRSARRGFNDGMDVLTSLKVKGHIQKTKKSTSPQDTLEVLFTGSRIKDNQCVIFFNERINWSFIAQYFTILPRYYFALPNRASDLLYYIFYLARQNTREIEERGYFCISFRAIHARLQLPDEAEAANPQRDIKDQIDRAIELIETGHSNLYGNTEFGLLPRCKDTAPIKEYLDTGYLEVHLKGDFAKSFIEVSREASRKIEAATKRKARIQEKAIANAIAERLKETDSQSIDTLTGDIAKRIEAEAQSAGTPSAPCGADTTA